MRVRLDLGGLLPENSHRVVCVVFEGERVGEEGCGLVVVLPGWARGLPRDVVEFASLYLAARALGDASAWAAYHLATLLGGRALGRGLAARLAREARVEPLGIREADMAAYWRGRARALAVLDRLRPVLVRVEPLDEGVEDALRRVGAEEVAPGLYLVPREAVPRLRRVARVEVLYDPTVPGLARRART